MRDLQVTTAQALLSKALETRCSISILRTASAVPRSEGSGVVFKPVVLVYYEISFPEKKPLERWVFEETFFANDSGVVSLAESFQTKLETMKAEGQAVPDFFVRHRSGSF